MASDLLPAGEMNDSDSNDSDSSTFEEEDGEEFTVDKILAEDIYEDGTTRYLVKWEEYDLVESTWEPKKNILDPITLHQWEDEKLRQKKGLSKPFDMASYYRLREEHEAKKQAAERQAKEKEKEKARKKRDAQRRKLGLEPLQQDGSSESEDDNSEEAEEDDSIEVSPATTQSKKPKPRPPVQQNRVYDKDADMKDASDSSDSPSVDRRHNAQQHRWQSIAESKASLLSIPVLIKANFG
jgi:hypothetical protein